MVCGKGTEREAVLTMIERNTMTMLLQSINAKAEHFPNEAIDAIRQFNSSWDITLFKVTNKLDASLLVMMLMNS
jgi:hypothetical protein